MKEPAANKSTNAHEIADVAVSIHLADCFDDIVARFDCQLRHTYVNQAVQRLTGRPPGFFVGKTNRELGMPGHLVDLWDESLRAVFDTGAPGELHFSYEGTDGLQAIISRLIPELDDDGRVQSVISVARNSVDTHQADSTPGGAAPRLTYITPDTEARHSRAIIQSSDDAIISKTLDGIVTSWNRGAEVIFGYSAQEMLGQSLEIIFPPERRDEEKFILDMIIAGTRVDHFETVRMRKDGSTVQMSVTISPIRNSLGEIIGASKIARDISYRKQAEERLRLASRVFTHASEGIMITARDGSIIDVNQAFTRITGYAREDVLGENPRILNSGRQDEDFYAQLWQALKDNGHWYGEIWNRRKNGEIYVEWQRIDAVTDEQGIVQNYVSLFTDISAQKEHESQLQHVANHDVLTGLPNRLLLSDRLKQAMAQALRRMSRVALAYLDLDGFKAINDLHGHHVGDHLLLAIASRMTHELREGDTLSRLGGDEFVAVLVDLDDPDDSVATLSRLIASANQPVQINDLSVRVTVSIGVTFFPQSEEVDADMLLRQADQAMYHAKLTGKNRYHFFDANLDRNLRGQFESIERIRAAFNNQEFVLYYQPKVNMRTRQLVGAEALIRWQHPDKGLLPPAAFLPIIENHPLAVGVGEWVMATALRQIDDWAATGLPIPISVNIGAHQLQQVDFVQKLIALIDRHPHVLKKSLLELEILETSALEDLARVSQTIEACRQVGVEFALDDFGTGYSSLTYLKQLPVAALKIDQSFIRDILDNPDDTSILIGVLGLAKAFQRQVIAEGVETVHHGKKLLELGCDLGQGYGIARPMPASQFRAWASDWPLNSTWI